MSSEIISGVRQLMFNESEFRKKFLMNIGNKINTVIPKSEWLKATALGGYREVGRSSLLLETPNSKIIIDCGVSPEPAVKGLERNNGTDENRAFPYLDSANLSINELDAVVLTHAHMDHIGSCPTCSSTATRGRSTARPRQGNWRHCCLTITEAGAEERRHAALRRRRM